MNKLLAIALLVLVVSPILMTEAMAGGGDENYFDHGDDYESSDGPGVSPEDGMQRLEPRTRNKDN